MNESDDQRHRQTYTEMAASEASGRNYKTSRVRGEFLRLMSNKALKITVGFLLGLFVLAGTSLLIYTWDQHLIVKGLKISGVNVSNLTEQQAEEVMNKEVQRILDQTVTLKLDKLTHEVTLEELGFKVSADSPIKKAYNYGRTGSIFSKALNKISVSKGLDLELDREFDETVLKETINRYFQGYNKPAVDASFQITPQNTMLIKKEEPGRIIDSDSLLQRIKDINIFSPASEINLESKEQSPQLSASLLEQQKITGLLSTYTTRFDPSQTARSENVRLAAKSLDGAVIKPGAVLSFNEIVGERTVDGGYKDAYIIVNGQFIPGLAGGICQVSSTLYNTGLLANLDVIQRSNHDLAISYVPLGQDATVAYPDLDLKFQNNSGGYLLLRTKVDYNTITIQLYGKVNPGQEVIITNSRESVIPADEQRVVDETLAHGVTRVKQEGQSGYIINSTRTVKVNGQVVKTELLKQSRYQPLPKIIETGA